MTGTITIYAPGADGAYEYHCSVCGYTSRSLPSLGQADKAAESHVATNGCYDYRKPARAK